MDRPIVLLDDDENILTVLEAHLSDHGYPSVAFISPSKALEHLRLNGAGLLITDLWMPEMDGIDVVQEAKAIDPDMSIIVITGLVEVSHAVDAIRVGADDYILKPFNMRDLIHSVERVLEKRANLLENRQYQETLEARVSEAANDLARINAELRATKEYLQSLLDSTVDAIISTNPDNVIEFVNDGAYEMLGYRRGELIGKAISEIYREGASELKTIRHKLDLEPKIKNYETELKRKDGTLIPAIISLSYVHKSEKIVSSVLAICKDVTEQKRLERELKDMSIRDSLTGLYNQRYFYERLHSEIERAKRQRHPLTMLLFDVDKFKQYNDTRGHLEGDQVLKAAGLVVNESTRRHVDIGFRYGGDEFTVLLPEADEQQALIIAERIRNAFLAHQFDHLSLSIGLMSYSPGSTMESFIRSADAMMYRAKRAGGNRVAVYVQEDNVTS
ncbi:MAG: hypothetical protein AMXMBFR84_21930 [Candidatus Hydrogenedentota bacterium]